MNKIRKMTNEELIEKCDKYEKESGKIPYELLLECYYRYSGYLVRGEIPQYDTSLQARGVECDD